MEIQTASESGKHRNLHVLLAALLSIGLSATAYLGWGDVGIDISDEGYLWYGVQRTVEGEIPLRDFQSYDPGRYYWCALLSPIFGTGILGVRASAYTFQALGMFAALLVASRFVTKSSWLAAIAPIVFVWMIPRHKLFDSATSLLALYAAVRLVEAPRTRNYLYGGIVVGVAGFIGRNHLLYCVLGFVTIILFLAWKEQTGIRELVSRFGVWIGGCAIGYSPMLLLFLCVPGFAQSVIKWTLIQFKTGTNIPKPYPWPWRVDWNAKDAFDLACTLGESVAFLLPPIMVAIGLFVCWRTSKSQLSDRAPLIAGTLLGMFYLHHVAERSALNHLGQSIHPLLMASISLPFILPHRRGPLMRSAAASALGLVSLFATIDSHHPLSQLRPRKNAKELVPCEVREDVLRVDPTIAMYFEGLGLMSRLRVGPEQEMFMGPYVPTLYALLDRKSPIWNLYMSRNRSCEAGRWVASKRRGISGMRSTAPPR